MAASLAEALSSAFDKAEAEQGPFDTPEAQDTPSAPVEERAAPANETAEQAADRARDEAGRFAKKDSAGQVPAKAGQVPGNPLDPAASLAPAEPRKPPTTWKKEFWEPYQKLDQPLADYIQQREQEYLKGVTNYKTQAEQARDLQEAIAPFSQDLQTHGIRPSDWIRNLGSAHQMLVKGSPEQKLQIFQKLASDYGVPLQAIQSGQLDPVMEYVAPLQQTVQELRGQLNSWQAQRQQQEQAALQSEIDAFASEHGETFDQVKDTMAGLLQSGLASDLKSAYDKAIRLNDDVWQAEQHRQAQAKREAEAQKVAQARAKAVSPKSATPAGVMATQGKKDVRSAVEEAFELHAGGGGRV